MRIFRRFGRKKSSGEMSPTIVTGAGLSSLCQRIASAIGERYTGPYSLTSTSHGPELTLWCEERRYKAVPDPTGVRVLDKEGELLKLLAGIWLPGQVT